MTRKIVVTAVSTAVLLVGLGAPALASPLTERGSVCLRLDPEGGREGVCVWVPLPD